MTNLDQASQEKLVERFLRYARIETASDRSVAEIPSTPSQWDLLKLLVKELMDLGVSDVELTANGYVIARIPSSPGSGPVIGLMAHVDTASDAPSEGVNPRLHRDYDGGVVDIGEGFRLDPAEFPELARYKGATIITTDGRTLLGADDKAGVAEIMTAVAWLQANPGFRHAPIEVLFTPDEETGKGLDRLDVSRLKARCFYTVDGGEEGVVEAECFNAYQVRAQFTGRVIHLGVARGKLVNAVSMAGLFLGMLPRSESPEATDGRYGYYCPLEIRGNLENATLDIFLRDFDRERMNGRLETLRTMAKAVEAIYPDGRVSLTETKQYVNMYEAIQKDPPVIDLMIEAVRRTGIAPELRVIRGGTDGSKLSAMGIPTPNLFTGGYNYHSRQEWAAVPAMVRAVETILNLASLWAERG